MEEKGGVLHILFIFVGIALLGLGLFYYFTDEKIELKEEAMPIHNTENNNDQEEKDLINQISLLNNIESEITLKNGNKVKIQYYLSDESKTGKFLYNGKSSFVTENEDEECELFYIYNNSIVSFCYLNTRTNGHLYVVDEKGVSSKINNINYEESLYIPEGISSKDNSLIVNSNRLLKKTDLDDDEKKIDLCNEEEVKTYNISTDSPLNAQFKLVINEGKKEFVYLNTTKTIKNFIDESCKIVE